MIILPSISSGFGMTLAEMVTEVESQLRNDNISDRIKSWLNQAMYELASNFEFPYLNSEATITSEVGIRNYLLASDLHWLKGIWCDGRTPSLLWPETNLSLAAHDPHFRSQTGTVYYYILEGRNISFWRVPANSETFTYTYQRRPAKMVIGDDKSALPPEWDYLLIQRAKCIGYEAERNPLLDGAKQEYLMNFKLLSKTVYHRPDFPVILKSYNNSPVALGRPQLPPNFPRIR